VLEVPSFQATIEESALVLGSHTPVRGDERRLEHRDELEQFLIAVERKALRVARLALGDTDDALDTVQNAMYRLVSHYSRKPSSEWNPLFFRILHNLIHDLYRSRRRENRMSVRRLAPIENGTDLDDPLLNLPAPARLQPEAEFERARDYERLAQAMQALPRRQREAFSLRMLEGLDVRTTSRVMACSEGSVKTHLARALNALRKSLQEES